MLPVIDAPLTEAARGDAGPLNTGERRRTARVPLHWKVNLSGDGSGSQSQTVTRDISCDGFYCLVDQCFRPGDPIECDIAVPTHRPSNRDEVAYLRCHARAVRVELTGGSPGYGLACRIMNYRLVRRTILPGDLPDTAH
jgi:hypothetical protein